MALKKTPQFESSPHDGEKIRSKHLLEISVIFARIFALYYTISA